MLCLIENEINKPLNNNKFAEDVRKDTFDAKPPGGHVLSWSRRCERMGGHVRK